MIEFNKAIDEFIALGGVKKANEKL